MTATDALLRAAARLTTDARLGRAPSDAALLAGTAASAEPLPPDARDAARRHLAIAEWLRSWAALEDADRAAELEDRATAQEALAVLRLADGRRYAA